MHIPPLYHGVYAQKLGYLLFPLLLNHGLRQHLKATVGLFRAGGEVRNHQLVGLYRISEAGEVVAYLLRGAYRGVAQHVQDLLALG